MFPSRGRNLWKGYEGILRGHQFDKIEMVCFCKPEDSTKLHNEMVAVEEGIWQSLGIPYQKLNICSGDLGNPAMKSLTLKLGCQHKINTEKLRAVPMLEHFNLAISVKYKKVDGSSDFVHTLNGTIIAFSRCLIALIENYQNEI